SILIFKADGSLLLSPDNKSTLPKNEIISQDWFHTVLNYNIDDYNMYFSAPHIQHLIPLKFPWVITFSKKIYYVDENGSKQNAILMIDMNFSLISEMIRSATLGTNGYLYILDNKAEIIYHPKQTLIYAGLFSEDTEAIEQQVFGTFVNKYKGRDRLTIIQTVNNSKWKLVGVVYLDELTKGMNKIIFFVILLTIILSLSSIIVTWFVTKKITAPIKLLEKEMDDFEFETSRLPYPIEGSTEVVALSKTYIQMIIRIRKLMGDIVTAQDLKRKSEFEALEAKINPHFLYNTLDSVIWLAEQGDTEDVVTLVQALSKLFRVSISSGHEIISIEEEIEHVSNYLLIQKMRYQNFDFEIDLPDELKNCPTIKLIIQPIVENAIYHGIKYLVDPGFITIKIKSEDDKSILISVADNGVGIDSDTIESLFDQEKRINNKESKSNGIGLSNVQERIKLAYGEEYGVSVESELDLGTTVFIKIPKQKALVKLKVASS
ncbi:MAG: sensor histidine kinase, partial [Spirochaetaceae bacterium]|nr:sensor histidine kinase [Spirochaetaceae bacterium]